MCVCPARAKSKALTSIVLDEFEIGGFACTRNLMAAAASFSSTKDG